MGSEEDADSVHENELEYSGGKCGIIFLIDARLPMFVKDFEDIENLNQSRFNVAIKCCRTVMMNKIIAREKDLIGIVLFGTDKFDQKTNTKHVTLLLDLNYPSAEAVKQLDQILRDVEGEQLQRSYGSSDDFLLADALWYCSSLFSNSGANIDEKRILLFTEDSDPHSSHTDRAHKARKRAKDLNQVKTSLELLPMGPSFNYTAFYKELIEIINGFPGPDELDPTSKLEELLERVNRLDFKTRRYSKIKWDLGKGVRLGVSLYTFYREAVVAPQEPLDRTTNEPVKRVKQTIDQATGELLLPSDIEEYLHIAGKEIVISNEERDFMRKVMEPGLTLLGFKPASFASEALHCGQPAFVYPEETLIKGSQELMKALVQRCAAREQVALVCGTPRNRAVTKYYCMIPSLESYNSDGKFTPCGFHLIPLPFYNDIREQTFEKSPPVDRETVELAKKLVKKLRLTYKPSLYRNPKLQQFWAHLEALALEYDAPGTIEDDTVQDKDNQTSRLDSLSQEFNNACSLDGFPYTSSKRPAASSRQTPAKRMKNSDPVNNDDIIKDIDAAIATKKVDKFTVEKLKIYLTSHNKSVSGLKKAQLVEEVYKTAK